jgi:site-specific DNA recombinase
MKILISVIKSDRRVDMKNNHDIEPLQWGDPKNALMRIAIYVRKSTATEGRSHSRAEQLERCVSDARSLGFSNDNITVFEEPEGQKGEWYWDDGRDRLDPPYRPELTRMMGAVEAGAIDVVMVYKADRLYRDNGVADAILKRFIEFGVRFFAQGRDVEIHSARGLYQAAVDGAAARQWRDQISEDIRRDQQYKAERGMFSRNPSCFGFRSKGLKTQEVEPIHAELEIVRRIFAMFVVGENGSGPFGITAIANKLMDERVRISVSARNHQVMHPEKVYTSQIRTILSNCMYVGRWRHRGQEYRCDRLLLSGPDGCKTETVVPIPLFEEAQRKLANSLVPGTKSLGATHLLTGIVVCGQCGRPMTINHRKRLDGSVRQQFICNHKRGSRPCNRRGTKIVQADVLDAWVTGHLLPCIVTELKLVRASSGRDAALAARTELERQLGVLRERESGELSKLIGVLDADQLAGVAAKFREERFQVEERLRLIESGLVSGRDSLPAELQNLEGLPKAAVKDAIRRAFLWIALTERGVVAMTTWGTSTAAFYADLSSSTYRTRESRRTLEPPSWAAAIESIDWFVDAKEFVRGQRESQPHRTRALADHEVVHASIEEVT